MPEEGQSDSLLPTESGWRCDRGPSPRLGIIGSGELSKENKQQRVASPLGGLVVEDIEGAGGTCRRSAFKGDVLAGDRQCADPFRLGRKFNENPFKAGSPKGAECGLCWCDRVGQTFLLMFAIRAGRKNSRGNVNPGGKKRRTAGPVRLE